MALDAAASKHIAFRDLAHGLVNDIHLYFLGGEFYQRIRQGFHRTIHVTFDNDVQFLEAANGNSSSDFIQCNMFLGPETLFTLQLFAFIGDILGLFFVFKNIEFVTRLRSSGKIREPAQGMRVLLHQSVFPVHCTWLLRGPNGNLPA